MAIPYYKSPRKEIKREERIERSNGESGKIEKEVRVSGIGEMRQIDRKARMRRTAERRDMERV